MAIERGDPIPAGRYWIDIPKARVKNYTTWRKANPSVKTTSTQESPKMTFIIFEVSSPVPRWPADWGLGFPNQAGAGVRQASDVIQRPKVETSSDMLSGLFAGVSGTAMLVLLALYLMSKKER